MTTGHRGVQKACAIVLCGMLLGAATATRDDRTLPAPTGSFGIGRTTFDWTDRSRPEIATGQPTGNRELLVYLFYPATENGGGRPAAYFPHLAQVEAYEERFGHNSFRESYGASYGLLATMRTHTRENVPPAATKERFPIVLFSPGGGIPVLNYTAIIEELVSHGYVVAAIEPSYDGGTIVFPDGRIISQVGWDEDAKRTPAERAAFHTTRIDVGAADDSFVLTQLEKLNDGTLHGGPADLQGRLDLTHAGAAGHSLGGKVATAACARDKRLAFCLNLDGGLDAGLTFGRIAQNVSAMYGYHNQVRRPGEAAADFERRTTSAERYLANLRAQYIGAPPQSRLLLVDAPGFSHYSYYDVPDAEAEVPPWNATPAAWSRNTEIIRAFTLASFDAALRAPEAGSPSLAFIARYPEVTVQTVGAWNNDGIAWKLGPRNAHAP
jgi:hypothetical protein